MKWTIPHLVIIATIVLTIKYVIVQVVTLELREELYSHKGIRCAWVVGQRVDICICDSSMKPVADPGRGHLPHNDHPLHYMYVIPTQQDSSHCIYIFIYSINFEVLSHVSTNGYA